MTEEHGAIPLPPASANAPARIWYDPSAVPGLPQQPQAQQVAVFEAMPNDDCINGSLLDVNQHFVVYAVKNGLIRVLHRSSSLRALLRGHTSKVTDICFFQNGDVLGSAGGNVIVWRIFHRSPEIFSEKLLEIPDALPSISRFIWHPFNPNQFWLIHNHAAVATLVETTRITTVASSESHAICQFHSPTVVMDGAVQLQAGEMTDLCWSGKDTRHVLTTHDDGTIRLWDCKRLLPQQDDSGIVPAYCASTIQQDEPVTRCMFLPHDNVYGVGTEEDTLTSAFLTASRGNSVVTIWSAFCQGSLPTKLQVFGIVHPSPTYNLDLCFGPAPPDGTPPAFFCLLSDRSDGKVYCVSLKSMWSENAPKRALAVGFDYVVPFYTKYPIYSWSMACVPAEHLQEDETTTGLNFDIKFHAYQSKMVQQYTLSHYMCLPPSTVWEPGIPGVRVESLAPVSQVQVDPAYDEDYELEMTTTTS